ncbi:MAG: preprotein translocase subunit Sec61beta [Candidatus Aenigmatarchaeota archaeon]|jgi:preprotein translocase subunit Sec61beta
MAKKDKVYIPTGIGGLIRYGEEEESKIKLKPEHVVYISLTVAVFVILMRILFH